MKKKHLFTSTLFYESTFISELAHINEQASPIYRLYLYYQAWLINIFIVNAETFILLNTLRVYAKGGLTQFIALFFLLQRFKETGLRPTGKELGITC